MQKTLSTLLWIKERRQMNILAHIPPHSWDFLFVGGWVDFRLHSYLYLII
jgi:hypothetical protein